MNKTRDKGSLWILVIAIAIFVLASVYDFLFLHIHIHSSVPLTISGILFIIIGSIIRVVATRKLKKQFSVFVKIQQNHRFITTGIYQDVRHPIYSAALLKAFGFILVMNTLLGLLLFFAVLVSAILYRISVEEYALLTAFGEEYHAYKRRVGGLLPKNKT